MSKGYEERQAQAWQRWSQGAHPANGCGRPEMKTKYEELQDLIWKQYSKTYASLFYDNPFRRRDIEPGTTYRTRQQTKRERMLAKKKIRAEKQVEYDTFEALFQPRD